ncbi:poly(A) polymerase I-like isoform X2 [Dioscorea cayenensis subsp. rotundata]|uniref:Poly(A) polymerase I-like isoform X2 n=1 Tax=Dioscorea cayennensis subsp. rotundata TaxID=55577 RepID=A0AB40BB89_DIOCR|nr:poly(A) polymerase I-like isoform X2 [Dioscorea cayenensis subsp. rotundata]
MAIVGISNVTRTSLPFRPPFVLACRRAGRRSSAAALETLPEITHDPVDNGSEIPASSPPPKAKVWEGRGWPEWKMMSSKELGIKASMITKPTKLVLDELKKKGYDVYLVGGCVRDLVMKRTPKDFDIITSAHLSEVKKTFSRCDIVGKRFPICHVHVKDSIVEVSSFCTSGRTPSKGLVYATRSHQDCNEHDYMRWRNCLARDFTINGLMFNPFSNLVYDYMGGMEDIKKAKVRTVIPAYTSFQEDCARILRAIRIAARLGFRFSKETAHSIKDLANSIMRLDKGRLLMEMNYMLAYGSAEASLRLLWKFGLLELLLPIQAAYFVSQGFRRRDKRSNMLLALFSNLDRLLAPDKPCHSCLWVGILAFHQALVKEPRDPLVIATFTLALHNGGDLSEAISIARRINHPHYVSFPELVEARGIDDDEELTKQVFIPLQVYLKVCRIFECIINRGTEKFFVPKQGNKINYFVLAQGGLAEVRHVFSRVVFDTIYPLKPQDCETST